MSVGKNSPGLNAQEFRPQWSRGKYVTPARNRRVNGAYTRKFRLSSLVVQSVPPTKLEAHI